MEGLLANLPVIRGKIRSSRSQSLGTKLTISEEREVVAAAAREGKTASEWAREVLLREARRSERDPLFTEIIATRMLLNLVLKPIACGERMTDAGFGAALATVRAEKHINALELMQQYTSTQQKER